jgi:hypothetical protein
LRFARFWKSTRWASNSGPSTQANWLFPSTLTRQPPHIPVPSTMTELRLTTVRMPWGRVVSATARIIGTGRWRGRSRSARPPDQRGQPSVTRPFSPWLPSSVVTNRASLVAADLVLEHDEVAGPAAEDRDHAVAGLLEGDRGGVGDRRPDAPADDAGGPEPLDLGGLAEGPDHVEDGVARLEGVEELRGLADALDHDRDVAAVGVRVGDRDRDPLAALVDAEDDELARLPLAGDAGSLDPEELDVRGDEAGFAYGKHGRTIR